MKKYLFIVLLVGVAFGQFPDTVWTKSFGGIYKDRFIDIEVTQDGGFALLGRNNSHGSDVNEDIWLLKTDENGSQLWEKTFGDENTRHYAQDFKQTLDGGYIIIGYAKYFPNSFNDIYIVKTDSQGNIEWEKIIGEESEYDLGYSVTLANDGSFIFLAETNSNVLVFKTDALGDIIWSNAFDNGSYNFAKTIDYTDHDNGCIMLLKTWDQKSMLLKMDIDGNQEWTKTYDEENEWLFTAFQTNYGSGYILGGTVLNVDDDDCESKSNSILIVTDSLGNELWNKTYDFSCSDGIQSIEEDNDGGFVILMTSNRIIKTDINGNTLWHKKYVEDSNIASYKIKQTDDSKFIAAGHIVLENDSHQDWDGWICKINNLNDNNLFISEYSEGSGNNKYIEIYNPSEYNLSLDQYTIKQSRNGFGWGMYDENTEQSGFTYQLSGILEPSDVFILSTNSASQEIINKSDVQLSYPSVCDFNGNDAIGLFYNNVLIDVIGIPNDDPIEGWDVDGVEAATKNHTLIRKVAINSGNVDWYNSSGYDFGSTSEWLVYDQDYWGNLGSYGLGCTDPDAENYYPDAIGDDGNCIYNGPVFIVDTSGDDLNGIGTIMNPFSSIQKGIDIASDGDTVFVLSGTYIENVNFNEKNVVVIGEDRDSTFIDGGGNNRLINLLAGNNVVTLESLTIKNGYSNWGGALTFGNGDTLTLNHCNFINNVAEQGGGVFNSNGGVVDIFNCLFENNSSVNGRSVINIGNDVNDENSNISISISHSTFNDNNSDSRGAVNVWAADTVKIVNSTFSNNYSGSYAGALNVHDVNYFIMENSHVLNNRCVTGSGGGISTWDLNYGLIKNSSIIGNVSEQGNGGGVVLWSNANMEIINSTIADNQAQSAQDLFIKHNSTLKLENSVVYNSNTYDQIGLYDSFLEFDDIEQACTLTLQGTNLIRGGLPYIYKDTLSTINSTGILFLSNPLFCGPEDGDYTLASNSPLISLLHQENIQIGATSVVGCEAITIGNVVINEIMNDPNLIEDSEGEWFELHNNSNEPINISGWVLKDSGDDSLTIPQFPDISPYGYFVLGVNADTMINGGVHIDFEYERDYFNLGNSDDEIYVYGFGELVDAVEYDGGTLFPDLNGKSMELIFPGDDNNIGSNWAESTNLLPSGDFGTPGQQNSTIYPIIESVSVEPLQDYILLTYNDDEEFFYADTGYFDLSIQNSGSGILYIDSIDVQLTQNIQNAFSVSQLPFSIQPFSTDTIEFGLISEQFGMAEVELFLATNDVNFDSSSIMFEVPIVAKDEVAYSIQSLDYWDYLDLGELTVGETIDTSITIISMGERALEIDDIYIPFQDTSLIQIEYEEGGLEMLETMEIAISITPNEPGYYYFEWQSSGIWIKIESNADIWSPNGCSIPQVPCEPQVGITFSAVSLSNDESTVLPYNYVLHQNYPNPFNPITSLRYDLPNDGLVNITIYDMMGRIVKTLVNGSQTAGFKSIQWNATNDKNEPVSAGLYLYTIQAGEFRQTKKMVLLK